MKGYRAFAGVAVLLLAGGLQAKAQSADAESGRPLPQIPALLQSVQENQKNIEQIVQNYISTRQQQEDELDGNGRVKKTTTTVYETFYVGRQQVSRLLSRNGKPLDEKEKQKEEEDVQKRIRKAQERQTKRESQTNEEREKNEFSVGMFLRVCRMVNPRREQFRGHEVIAFDFEPNPQYKTRNKTEEIAQKLNGTVWVDEDAKQIVRLESRLRDGVKFAGFLASLRKGAAIIFEQQRINEEVWLPSLVDVNLSVRVIFKGKSVHMIERYSDYRKFRVDTVIKPVESAP
jgi:hypothetical protein